MSDDNDQTIRRLNARDYDAIARIATESDYVYSRFDQRELERILTSLPAVGVFSAPPGPLGRFTGGTLHAFLLVNQLAPPSAWIGGFGVSNGEARHFQAHLARLLPALEADAAQRGARHLYYSGGDTDNDWLAPSLKERGFTLVTLLRSYDKIGFYIPSHGAQDVRVRPFTPADLDAVLAVEELAFDQLWRYDAPGFLDIAREYPYFVVAEDEAGVVGYQFNALDQATGYLVRIAVHSPARGRGVGVRLLAEAVDYFARAGVTRILLNTQEDNTRAHRLYEWFGFERVEPSGFVLGRPISVASA
ncbi:MAG TPA: GNAT family N-acetyltransferase [Ktedonobacterales bacterium]|jgi:GNAT superfamily N-acetyltransferase